MKTLNFSIDNLNAIDSYLYAGNLYVFFENGRIAYISFTHIVRILQEQYPSYRNLFELAFLHNDYINTAAGRLFLGVNGVRDVILREWKKAQKEICFSILFQDIEKYFHNIGEWNSIPLDIRLYAMRLFIGCEDGLYESIISQDDKAKVSSGKINKVFDSRVVSVNAKYGVIAISADEEGLFSSSLIDDKHIKVKDNPDVNRTSLRTDWKETDILNYDAGYVNQNAAEIGVDRLNDYQTNFMIQENKYAFYVSGDWLMQEVQNNTTVELDSTIKMMKVPVASNILEATNSYSAGNEKRLPNITSDEVLSQVVAYVDGQGELPAGVTQEEAEYIRSARNMVATLAPTHTVFAPTYSNAKALADKFLLFMASDEGIQIFKDNCAGGFSPFQYAYDYEKLHETEKSIYDCTKDAIYVGYYRVGDIFSKANVQPYNLNTYFVDMMTAKNGQTPEEYNNVFLTEYSDERWSTYLNRLFE